MTNLRTMANMREHKAQGVFWQLMSAVQYCHQRGIIHRELKPWNVLLDAVQNIKLADFGLSNEYIGQKLTTFCGSLHYIIPEMLLGQGYDGPGTDVWSLGVILYKMVSGKLPFVVDDIRELQQKIPRGQYYVSYFISSELVDILGKYLTIDTYY